MASIERAMKYERLNEPPRPSCDDQACGSTTEWRQFGHVGAVTHDGLSAALLAMQAFDALRRTSSAIPAS
jgi:hypothetical protein